MTVEKNLLANADTGVKDAGWSLGWEDPLEKEMATHSSILAWRIPGTEEPGRLQTTGSQWVGHHLVTKQQTTTCEESWCCEPQINWDFKRVILTIEWRSASSNNSPLFWLLISSSTLGPWNWKSLTHVWLLQPHGLYSPWNSPGHNTGVGSLSLL